MTERNLDFLNADDEQLLQSFFADCQEDIPDDGFSQRVMRSLPDTSPRRLERWWQVACVLAGIAILVLSQSWNSLLDSLFMSKVEGMLVLSRVVCHVVEVLGQSHNLLMLMLGLLTLSCVWGYNKLLDARY